MSTVANNLYDRSSPEYYYLSRLRKTNIYLPYDNKYYKLLYDNGFDMRYKIIKYYYTSEKKLHSMLQALCRIESSSDPQYCNLAICYDCEIVNPSIIKYIISKYTFVRSRVFYFAKQLSDSNLILALNTFAVKDASIKSCTKPLLMLGKSDEEISKEYCYQRNFDCQKLTIKTFRTYDYKVKSQIIKVSVANTSSHKLSEILHFFVPIEDNGYFAVTHKSWLCITNFNSGIKTYIKCSSPILECNVCDNGVDISVAQDIEHKESKRLYFALALAPFDFDENNFEKATKLLSCIAPLQVLSDNEILDDIVNNKLPRSIIKELLQHPYSVFWDYYSECNGQVALLQHVPQTVKSYFAIIQSGFGITFRPDGIVLGNNSEYYGIIKLRNRSIVINTRIGDKSVSKINGIEYSNVPYFSYRELDKKNIEITFG